MTLYSTIQEHIFDIMLTAVVYTGAALCHWLYTPYDCFFLEQNPHLSYPYIPDSVPTVVLILLAVPVPMIIIFCSQIILRHVNTDVHPRAINMFLSQLAFLESMGMQLFIVEFLKSFLGRKRPNFFAHCNYQGYRDAMGTGNYTSYLALTTPGKPGSLTHCWDKVDIADSQKSFPSGESGFIFNGLGFVGIYSLYLLNHLTNKQNMSKGFLSFCMFFVAVLIAGFNPREYWNFYEDILGGAIIGLACATFGFILNFGDTLHSPPREEMFQTEEDTSTENSWLVRPSGNYDK